MKKSVLTIVALMASWAIAWPGEAHAQLLLDEFLSGSSGAKTETGALAHGPMTSDALIQHIQEQGYSNVSASPTNPGQFAATSPAGTPVLLSVEPSTGQIIGVAPQ